MSEFMINFFFGQIRNYDNYRSFFCAFEPKVRPLWAKRMQELLNPGGELITLMYPVRENHKTFYL